MNINRRIQLISDIGEFLTNYLDENYDNNNDNNLVEFKSLMESEAVLVSSIESKRNLQTDIINLIKRFEGVINAEESKYVMLNVDTLN